MPWQKLFVWAQLVASLGCTQPTVRGATPAAPTSPPVTDHPSLDVGAFDAPPAAPLAGNAATTRRMARWRAMFDRLSAIQPSCPGYRTGGVQGQTSLVLPARCFFAPGHSPLMPGAEPTVATLASVMREAPEVYFLVGVHSPERVVDGGTVSAWQRSALQAAALVTALVAHGVSAEHLAAVGYGDEGFHQEVYDGPADLAPGEALIEVVLMPAAAELPRPELPRAP